MKFSVVLIIFAITSLIEAGESTSNLVVEVHQAHSGTDLWYRVGIINPTSQAIEWGEGHKYGSGRLPMCDLDGDTIVEVHEGHGDLTLWYRVGTVNKKTRMINWEIVSVTKIEVETRLSPFRAILSSRCTSLTMEPICGITLVFWIVQAGLSTGVQAENLIGANFRVLEFSKRLLSKCINPMKERICGTMLAW